MGPGIVENSLDYHTNNIANSTFSTNNIANSTYSNNNIATNTYSTNKIAPSMLDINSVLCDQDFGDSIIPIYNMNNVSGKLEINNMDRYRFPKHETPEMLSLFAAKSDSRLAKMWAEQVITKTLQTETNTRGLKRKLFNPEVGVS